MSTMRSLGSSRTKVVYLKGVRGGSPPSIHRVGPERNPAYMYLRGQYAWRSADGESMWCFKITEPGIYRMFFLEGGRWKLADLEVVR